MILDELGKRILFFDGAMGTLLQARGLQPGELPETWNLSHPDVVRDIHLQYLRAGADVITTNTFGANALKYGERVEETVAAAVGIARQAVEQVRPGAIWLGESVHLEHIRRFREQGYYAATDTELFDAFDILYPYDLWPLYEGCTEGQLPLSRYFDAVDRQELSFPTEYNKLRCLENHDQRRAAARFPQREVLLAWTALSYFMKGTTLLYAGQEVCAEHTPSLFEKEPCL